MEVQVFNARRARFWSPLVISILIALLSLLLFERLADEMLEGETRQFDSTVRSFVHGFASPRLTWLMRILTDIGNADGIVVGTTVTCAVLWVGRRRNGAVLLAINTFGSVVLMWSLKLLLHRQRPEPYFGITTPHDYSFPSGHALVAFCFYGALTSIITAEQQHWLIRVVVFTGAGAMIFGIGMSRIYLGVHYPSDVIAGYLAGLFWTTGVSLVYRRFRERDLRGNSKQSNRLPD